jgi:hypothetical protein
MIQGASWCDGVRESKRAREKKRGALLVPGCYSVHVTAITSPCIRIVMLLNDPALRNHDQ